MNRTEQNKAYIESGDTALGIEFGSTRIKAVLVGKDNTPIAQGSYEWENKLENGIWTYSEDAVWAGLQDCYGKLAADVKAQYGLTLQNVGAIGFSAMMHGYMAFNKEGKLLVPFRTWRNTMTEQASSELTKLFSYHIPQRWSIAHLYQAMLNEEAHVPEVDFMTTLDGYVHWKLTGKKVLGIGEASGMFPIDPTTGQYNAGMLTAFEQLAAKRGYGWKLREILPEVLMAGEPAGVLSKEGAKLLDVSGNLRAGIPLCPPEGDAGTGMVATNSIAARTGNISAGTSVFAMVVMEEDLKRVHEEIDIVTTPTGKPVGMVHCNNCTSDLNAWVSLFKECLESFGQSPDADELYGTLYKKALEGEKDCGGLMSYNYFSGETLTGFEEGRPLFVRSQNCRFHLDNFMRTHLYSALGALKVGMDILTKEENVQIDRMLGHGGLYKTKEVGQRITAAALNAPISVMETAGEGGAWGMALLASYMKNKADGETLDDYLDHHVFAGQEGTRIEPDPQDVKGFEAFMEQYLKALPVERAAVTCMP